MECVDLVTSGLVPTLDWATRGHHQLLGTLLLFKLFNDWGKPQITITTKPEPKTRGGLPDLHTREDVL